jgi:hypothetical protein
MKKLFTLTLLGLAGLALTAGSASAGWTFHCGCKCYVNLRCKQYNAFSPYCCEFMPAYCPAPCYVPNPAFFNGHAGDGCYGGACVGEVTGAPVATVPGSNGYVAANQTLPTVPMQTLPQQAWQNVNPAWMHPTSMPSNYPGYAPSIPVNNFGR